MTLALGRLLAYASYLGASAVLVYFIEHAVDAKAGGAPLLRSLAIDVGLLFLFASQHSVLARNRVKLRLGRWHRVVYVLTSSLAVSALCLFWQPVPGTLWDSRGAVRWILVALSAAGWLITGASTFQLHPGLGLWGPPPEHLVVRGMYRWVRHPNYLGLLLVFWSAETMTAAHLVFSVGLTVYTLAAIPLEERDLVREFGESYLEYQRQVPAILPLRLSSTRTIPTT